jgi:hypothetical protein
MNQIKKSAAVGSFDRNIMRQKKKDFYLHQKE